MIERRRAKARNQLQALVCSGRSEDSQARGASDLHGGAANASAGSMNKDGFCGPHFRDIVQCVVCSCIGNPDTGALCKCKTFGKREDRILEAQSFLRVRAADVSVHVHAIAGFEAGHVRADGVDDTGCVKTRRVGKRRLFRIGAGTNVGIHGIHAGCADRYDELFRPGLGIGDLFKPSLPMGDQIRAREWLSCSRPHFVETMMIR
jgi:hypothetical protein